MRYLIIWLSIVLLSFSSCKFQDVEIGDIKDLSIKEMTKEYIALSFMVSIKNPNNFKFKITNVDLDLTMNGVEMGRVYKIDKVVVPKNSNKSHKFSVRIKMKNIAKGGFALLGSLFSKKVKLKLNGHVKAKAFLVASKKIDVDFEKKISLFKD